MTIGRPRGRYSMVGILPKGNIAIGTLGAEYATKLDRLARKWKCETLAEAAIELLKDAIDEELEK